MNLFNLYIEAVANKKRLVFDYKCTDADDDGNFEDEDGLEFDTNQFAEIIAEFERHEISQKRFLEKFELPKNDNILSQIDPRYKTKFYATKTGACIFLNEDTHYIYKIV